MAQLQSIYTVTLTMVREQSPLSQRVATPDQAAYVVLEFLGDVDREYFLVLLVDTRNRVTGINVVSIGSLNGSLVHPREVWKAAILGNAAGVILAHNHPSGDVNPSREDRELTRRLVDTGRIIGIEVLDHIVVGHDKAYFSFKERGQL